MARVLIVENEKTDLLIFLNIVERAGHEVYFASGWSGRRGIGKKLNVVGVVEKNGQCVWAVSDRNSDRALLIVQPKNDVRAHFGEIGNGRVDSEDDSHCYLQS